MSAKLVNFSIPCSCARPFRAFNSMKTSTVIASGVKLLMRFIAALQVPLVVKYHQKQYSLIRFIASTMHFNRCDHFHIPTDKRLCASDTEVSPFYE